MNYLCKGCADWSKWVICHGCVLQYKRTALMKAAEFGHLETVRMLLAAGANRTLRNKVSEDTNHLNTLWLLIVIGTTNVRINGAAVRTILCGLDYLVPM